MSVFFVLTTLAFLLMHMVKSNVVVTPDGVRYISTAENLVAGKGYVDFAGKAPTSFTPGYSVALAAAMSILHGTSRDNVVKAVNFMALVCIGMFSWLILARYVNRWWSLFGAIATMLSPLIVSSAHAALSECLFTALALAWAYFVVRGENEERWRMLAAFLGVAVCLTRHAGAGLMLGVMVIFHHQKRAQMGFLGLEALALWFLFAGKGNHHIFLHNPLPDLADMASGYWFCLGPLIALGLWMLWKRAKVLAWSVIGWTATIVIVLLLVDIGDCGSRMIIPAVALLTLGAFMAKGHLNRVMVAILAIALMAQSRTAIADIPKSNSFNSPEWKKSATLAALAKENIPDSWIFSSAPDGIWYSTGRMTSPLPRFDDQADPGVKLRDDTCFVVYFKSQMTRKYYGDEATYAWRIADNPNGQPARYDLGDAIILRLRPVIP
jgi:hypothetical protein